MPLSIPRPMRRLIRDLGLRDDWVGCKTFQRTKWFETVDRCRTFLATEKPGSEEDPTSVIRLLKFVVEGSPDFEALMDDTESSIIEDDDDCNEAGAWLIYAEYTEAVEAEEWEAA